MEGRGRDVWIYMTCPALPRKMVGNSPRTGISFFFPILGAAMAGRNRPRSEVPVIPTRPRTRRQPNDAAPKIPPSSRPSRPVPASTPRLRTRRPPANCLPLDLLFQIGACTTQAWPQNGKVHPAMSCTLSSFSSMLDSFVHSRDDSFNNPSHLGWPRPLATPPMYPGSHHQPCQGKS